jgi:hypothetical protein
MTGRRRAVATAVALVAVAAVAHLDLRSDLARTDRQVAGVERRVGAMRQEAAAAQRAAGRAGHRARSTEADLAAAGDRAAALADRAVATLADGEALAGALGDDLSAVSDDLRTVSSLSQAAGERAAALDRCLRGVLDAIRRRGGGDAPGAVMALAAVAGDCAAVDDAVAGPGSRPPVLPFDFADPDVVEVAGRFYGYATNGGGGNVQLIRSDDLVHWQWLGDAMPHLPPWAGPGRTWAPAVLPRPGGAILYYSARERASGRQCLGAAAAARPEGPFVDRSAQPFLCQHERGGSIDPSAFVDRDGRAYLLWKSEDETVGGRATLWAAPLAPNGLALAGAPHALLSAQRPWEHGTIEGPAMVADGGGWSLLYSGSSWSGPDYGVGHARCDGPLGPCRRSADGPFLRSFGDAVGAGGAEVLRDGTGRLWLVFHAWTAPHVGFPNRRTLRMAVLDLSGGVPRLSPG